jgi:large repetitive protein
VTLAWDPGQLEAPLPGSVLTFTPATWNQVQVVTVRAVDDDLAEGPHTSTITLTAASSDANFGSLSIDPVVVAIEDDDMPAFIVTAPADLTMREQDGFGTGSPSRRTIRIALATRPASPVTVLAGNPGSQVVFASSPLLVLNSTNWNTGVDIVVGPLDDDIAELDPHEGIVTFMVQPGSDPAYASLLVPPVTFQIADDDVASITCSPFMNWTIVGGRLQMAESRDLPQHQTGCRVTLGSVSTADVVVAVTASPQSQLEVAPAVVTIPAGSQQAEVVFTTVDDDVAEGTHPARVDFAVTSSDPVYDAVALDSIDVDIQDDDVAGFVVDPAGPITITEGAASATFRVRLTSRPGATVTVRLSGDSQVSVSPATLTFLPATWNAPQTVTVTAVDDPFDEPDGHPGIVSFVVEAGDPDYDGAAIAPVTFSIIDNDTPMVIVQQTGDVTAVAESGGSDTIRLRLGTQPISDVAVAIATDTQVTAAPATVTFTPANWNVPQDVTVRAVQDLIVEGDHVGNVSFSISSNDISYAQGSSATPGAVVVRITDDDVAGLTIVESDGSTAVAEGGKTDTYTIALSAQPLGEVTIAADGMPQVTAAPTSVTFSPADWNQPRTITLTAVQDDIDEADPHPGVVTHRATSTAFGWDGANLPGITAMITDDDTAQVIVVQREGGPRVTEGGAGDTITLRLASQPTGEVSIRPANADGQLIVADKPIVFRPTSWKDPVLLSIAAVDDQAVEDLHEGTITFKVTSEDRSYARQVIAPVIVQINDNDVDRGTNEFDDGDDDEQATRGPRTSLPPVITRPSGGGSGRSEQGSGRTDEGRERTDEGRSRLPSGVTGRGGQDEGAQTDRRLGGEIAAAREEEETGSSRGLIAVALGWLQDHWELWVPLLSTGMVVVGAASYMLRNDPVKVATRAASARRPQTGASGTGGVRGRKVKSGRRKRKGDDDDEDEDRPGRSRPPRGR